MMTKLYARVVGRLRGSGTLSMNLLTSGLASTPYFILTIVTHVHMSCARAFLATFTARFSRERRTSLTPDLMTIVKLLNLSRTSNRCGG